MQRKARIGILLSVLAASVFAGVGSTVFLSGGAGANPAVLTLGARQQFKYTNCTRVYSFTIDVVADSVYNITLTNMEGCNLWLYAYEWGYTSEVAYCASGVAGEAYNQLFSFSMGVFSPWDSENYTYYFKAVASFKIRINVFTYSYQRNVSIAWEDLGGWILVTDLTSTLMDKTPFNGWWNGSLNNSYQPFLYRRIEVQTSGFYVVALNSTVNMTMLTFTMKGRIYAEQEYAGTFSDCDTASDVYSYLLFLCAGIYYIRAESFDAFCSWTFSVSSAPGYDMTPGGLPENMTMRYPYDWGFGDWRMTAGVRVNNLKHGVLYDWNVTCPAGYDVIGNMPFIGPCQHDYRGTSEPESGCFVLLKSGLPVLQRIKGVDVWIPPSSIVGYDWEYGTSLERDYYTVSGFITDYCHVMQHGDLFDVIFFFDVYNKTVELDSPSVLFSVWESPRGIPEVNQDNTTYNFLADSIDDGEGIYKIPASATGAVDEFQIDHLSDNGSVHMDFLSWWYWSSDQGAFGEGGTSWYFSYMDWNTDPNYWDSDNGWYRREIAVLADTWVVIQDTDNFGTPGDNTTTFNMWYEVTPASPIGAQFNRECFQDLVLLRASLACCDVITIDVLFGGTVSISMAYYMPVDGVSAGFTSYACRSGEYFVLLYMSTGDGIHNLGTFTTKKTTAAALSGAIPGYLVLVVLGVSGVSIGLLAKKLKFKTR